MERTKEVAQLLMQLEQLEIDSEEIWDGEVAIRQQDIGMDWQTEFKEQIMEIAEEWYREDVVVLREIANQLNVHWKGDVAKDYQEGIKGLMEYGKNTSNMLNRGV